MRLIKPQILRTINRKLLHKNDSVDHRAAIYHLGAIARGIITNEVLGVILLTSAAFLYRTCKRHYIASYKLEASMLIDGGSSPSGIFSYLCTLRSDARLHLLTPGATNPQGMAALFMFLSPSKRNFVPHSTNILKKNLSPAIRGTIGGQR